MLLEDQMKQKGKKEKKSGPLDLILGLGLIALGFGLAIWKCRFGLDLTDETFYLAPAWKMLSHGDKPFLDEVYNGPRQSDLLNYLFIRHVVPFSILWIRIAAVTLYASVVVAAVWVLFKRCSWFLGGAIFYLAVVFDVFSMPTWSYNWWARDLLILNITCLGAAYSSQSLRHKVLLLSAAGIAVGLAAVAHNALLGACLGSFILIFAFRNVLKLESVWWVFIVAALIPMAADLAYLLSPNVRPGWLESLRVHQMAQQFEGSKFSFKKFIELIRVVLIVPEFWLVGALTFAVWFQGKLGKATLALAGLAILYVGYRLYQLPAFDPVQGTYHRLFLGQLGLAYGAGVAILLLAFRVKDLRPFAALTLVGIVAGAIMGLTSVNHAIAIIWCAPVVLLSAGSAIALIFPRPQPELRVAGVSVLAYLIILTTIFAFRSTYYDVSPGEATYTVTTPPFQGLQTSERRGYLLQQLEHLAKGRKFALSYVFLPGVFLLGDVRASTDTLIISHENSREMAVGFLRRMVSRDRLPEIIFETKLSPWTWGMPDRGLYFQAPIRYGEGDAFIAYRKCAASKVVAVFPEFEAYEIDLQKARACVP